MSATTKRGTIVKLGVVLSVVHAVVPERLVVHTFTKSMARFDDPGITVTTLETIAGVAAGIFVEPMHTLRASWPGQPLQSLELLLFLLNSIMWGLALAVLFVVSRG